MLIIFAIIRFEYSFDNYHTDPDRIFRIVRIENSFGVIGHDPGVPEPLPRAVRADFPEFELVTIVDHNIGSPVISIEQPDGSFARYKENQAALIDPDYFQIFHYDWLHGDPKTALSLPNTVVITQVLAQKYFGGENPVGKTLNINNGRDVHVTGVVKPAPKNTDLPISFFLRFEFDEEENGNWGATSTSTQCFVKLAERIDPAEVNARFDALRSGRKRLG